MSKAGTTATLRSEPQKRGLLCLRLGVCWGDKCQPGQGEEGCPGAGAGPCSLRPGPPWLSILLGLENVKLHWVKELSWLLCLDE